MNIGGVYYQYILWKIKHNIHHLLGGVKYAP